MSTNVIDDAGPAPDTAVSALDANEDAFGPAIDAAPEDTPVTDAFTLGDAGPVPVPRDVDLLFVVDNSGSMAEEQANLILELPRLVQVLATGDLDGDGAEDFTPPSPSTSGSSARTWEGARPSAYRPAQRASATTESSAPAAA